MKNVIERIIEGTKLQIKGKEYEVITKTVYSPLSNTEQRYVKFVLSDNYILVSVPYMDFIGLGYVDNCFGTGKDFPDSILYNGVEYQKVDDDYQLVKELVFGNPLVAEGEVFYADYINENTNISISLGFVCRTGERADVIQEVLSINDIKMEC